MREALDLLGKLTGWGDHVTVTLGHCEIRTFVGPDETVGTGRFMFHAHVSICGIEGSNIQGEGKSPMAALFSCCRKIIEYHKEQERYHRERREAAEKAFHEAFEGES